MSGDGDYSLSLRHRIKEKRTTHPLTFLYIGKESHNVTMMYKTLNGITLQYPRICFVFGDDPSSETPRGKQSGEEIIKRMKAMPKSVHTAFSRVTLPPDPTICLCVSEDGDGTASIRLRKYLRGLYMIPGRLSYPREFTPVP